MILLSVPFYVGVLYLCRYLKIIKPLKQFEVSNEKSRPANNLKSFLGSINGLLFWVVEIFFLIFLFLGLYTLIYKPEKWGAGLLLVIFSGLIAAFILYVIFLKYRSRGAAKRLEKRE
jgi:hypothetical protein